MTTIDRICAVLIGYEYLRGIGVPHGAALCRAVSAAANRSSDAPEPLDQDVEDRLWRRRGGPVRGAATRPDAVCCGIVSGLGA